MNATSYEGSFDQEDSPMIRTLHKFVGICILIYPLIGLASTPTIHEGQRAIEVQLKTSIDEGMTIDEAVAQSITATPHNGEEITKVALSIYKKLPRTACAIRAKDGSRRLTIWPDFKACGDRIVDAAIKAGADPTTITTASAAGLPESNPTNQSSSDKSIRKTFEISLYALHILRKIFLAGAN